MSKFNKRTLFSLAIMTAMLIGLSASSISFVAADAGVREAIGHDFDEEYWGILFDVISETRVKDLTPGQYANDYVPQNKTLPPEEATFYGVYINTGAVQTMYLTLMKYTRNRTDEKIYGTAPFQVLLQHFRAPGGKHVLVQNSFMGLLAYQDNGTTANKVPDPDDAVYFGYTLNSQYHKKIINDFLKSELGYSPFNEDLVPIASPINITKTEYDDGTVEFKFGATYENLFSIWQPIDTTLNLNGTSSVDLVFQDVVAISEIDSINFTYTLKTTAVEDKYVNTTITTEYDIGKISDLWIVNDDKDATEAWGGTYFDLSTASFNLSRYNATDSITDRLNGNDTQGIPGFSLAVANFARAVILSATVEEQNNVEVQDKQGTSIDGDNASKNVTRLMIKAAKNDAFLIDFESKPNYTLNGGEPMAAPVKLFPGLKMRNPVFKALDDMGTRFIARNIKPLVDARIKRTAEKLDVDPSQIKIEQARGHVYYAICFPEWSGGQINQDPTFVAYAEPFTSTATKKGIDGYTTFSLIIASAAGLFVLGKYLKKKRL